MSVEQIYPTTGVGERVEHALVLDCRLHGCKAKIGYEHEDHGRIYPLSAGSAEKTDDRPTINGHAARLVKRTVVLPEWEDERKATIDALQEVADQIEAELICCDVWERRAYEKNHAICYWGGAARELVLSKIHRLETDA